MPTLMYETIHESLRGAIPEFSTSIAEHLRDYEELLPHVLFGDLTRFVLSARERHDGQLVDRCLRFLDLALRDGEESVQNLVAVSFVENVGPWEVGVEDFIASWPETLRAEAERQRTRKPSSA